MKRIIPLVKTIQIDQDNFTSDFKKTKLVWDSFDEPLIDIQASNVTISNLDLHVKSNNKSPALIIGNSTKMLNNITFDSVTISCTSDIAHILNVRNIKFTKCLFRSKDIRTCIFVLSDVYNIQIDNCTLDGGSCSFNLISNTAGSLIKSRISNSDFLFNFTSGSMSKWIIANNSFNNIHHTQTGKTDSNLFITYGNQFHSSNSEGLLNNLNQFNEEEIKSRQVLDDIGNIFTGGNIPSPTTSPVSINPFSSIFGSTYSIGQILLFIAVAFVILFIIIIIIVFIVRVAKGRR